MSVVVTMTTAAIAISISAAAGSAAVIPLLGVLCDKNKEKDTVIEPVITRFADKETLIKTMSEHGFLVEEHEDGVLTIATSVGSLRYFQTAEDQPFWVQPFDIKDEAELEAQQQELIEEYMLNVQKSTYVLLKQQLEKRDDMTLDSEEFLEDETILLRIDV